MVLDRFAQGEELLWAEGDGDGFAGDLAGPLVAGTRRCELGPIQHRTLTDIARAGQAGAQALVVTLERLG